MFRRLRALWHKDSGFTLVEVLVAMGGVGVLTAAGVLVAHFA
jgi:prepilin-type N-terminal cleavage/methylation domain-containing protein